MREEKGMSFANKKIVFTGALQSFKRERAEALAHSLGAIPQSYVSQTTDFLVKGYFGVNLFDPDKESKKLIQALEYQELGTSIIILSEQEFLTLSIQELTRKKTII